MIITCALSPFTSLPPSTVASPNASAPSTVQSTVSATPKKKSFDEIKKDIENEVTELAKTIKQLENQPTNDDVTKRLSDCESKLSALKTAQKLAEFAEQLDTATNTNNNILTNLCSGLETFLGFNKDSKGYDGKGIVYSDLDRLCDGVMGFLSGVLSAVKDDDAVKTYDEYMADRLESVLKLVDNNIGSGRTGLADAVAEVKRWLKNYLQQFGALTTGVTFELSSLKDRISGKYNNGINASQGLGEQLGEWKSTLDKIEQDVAHIENNGVNKLDTKLRNSLIHEMKVVRKSVQVLKESAENGFVGAQAPLIDRTLNDEEKHLIDKIGAESTVLQARLKDEFNEIKSRLSELHVKRKEQFGYVKNAITLGKLQIDEYISEFNNAYKHKIDKLYTDLKSEMNNIIIAKGDTQTQRSQLRVEFERVTAAVAAIELLYKERLKKVKASIDKAVRLAKDAISNLQTRITSDLRGIKSNVKYGIENYVDGLKKAGIKNLKGKVQEGLWDLRNVIESDLKNAMEQIITEIQLQVKTIKGEKSTETALQGVVDKVQEYVDALDTLEKFKRRIGKFINTILGTNEIVRGRLMSYVENYKASFDSKVKSKGNETAKILPDIIPIVKTKIESMITGQVIGMVKASIPKEQDTIENKLKAIYEYMKDFAAQLGSNINTSQKLITGKNAFVDGIVMAIEKVVVEGGNSTHSFSIYDAVADVLAALHSNVSQVYDELESLAEASKGTNIAGKVKGAFDTLLKLDNNLDRAHRSDATDNFVGKFDKKIKAELNTKIGEKQENIQIGALQQLMTAFENSNSELIKAFDTKVLDEKIHKAFTGINMLDSDESFKVLMKHYSNEHGIQKVSTQVAAMESAVANDGFTETKGTADFNPKDMTGYQQPDANPKYNEAVKQVNNIITNELERLPNMVDEKKADALRLLEMMHNQFYSLRDCTTEIEVAAENAKEILKNGISSVYNAYDEAHRTLRNTIQSLTQNIIDATTKAFSTLTTEVRILYTEGKRADLQAIKNLITRQTKSIERIIDENINSGIKGLMRKLNGEPHPRSGKKRDLLADIKMDLHQSTSVTKEHFENLSTKFHTYFTNVHTYINSQIPTNPSTKSPTTPSPTDQTTDPATQLTKIKEDFDNLLTHLSDSSDSRKCNYDNKFAELLASLKNATNDLSPSAFANPRHPELLDAVKKGLEGFVGEMERVYVNGYDGRYIKWFDKSEGKNDLTVSGKNCAKVFLSIIPIVGTLIDVNKTCMKNKWSREAMFKTDSNNPVAKYFKENGYDIPSSRDKQDGELRRDLNGMIVAAKITAEKKLCEEMGREEGKLKELYDYLNYYYEVCHLSTLTATRQPCSVFEMLCWLNGLTHQPVYFDLTTESFSALFDKPEKKERDDGGVDSDDDAPMFIDLNSQTLAAYPQDVTYSDMHDAIIHVTHESHDLLRTILGTGDEYTTYACDLSSNSLNLQYPKRADDCLQSLLDILRRLLPCLHFLRSQCSLGSSLSGWAECKFGKDVQSSTSHCSDHSDVEPNRQPTSPLMSYLRDCLPGCLPHQLSNIGCKPKCSTCPKSTPGMPCLTPLGFRGFSGSTKVGKDLCKALTKFLDDANVSCLFALMPQPPATLSEHFGFASSLVKSWVSTANVKSRNSINFRLQSSFESASSDISMELYSNPSDLTKALTNAYGSQSVIHDTCKHHHVLNLASADICPKRACSPYLSTLSSNVHTYLPKKHVKTYFSWAIYLPWDFHNYLQNLLQAFKDILCQDWGCKNCPNSGKCKRGQHGLCEEDTEKPYCHCNSIVTCKGVSAALYKYGFTFEDAQFLSSINNVKMCSDFQKLLSNIVKSDYFTKLFNECDNFLYYIRFPFMTLTLALWLLSLLYLLHIMVIRLDLLHIKSHLHSPSSHRIAAQSLLAAARVNKLNRVFYLQP